MFGSVPQLTKAVRQLIDARTHHKRAPVAQKGRGGDVEHDGEGECTPGQWFVLIDLSACEGCDFGAMQELVKMRSAVEASGGLLRVTTPPAHSRARVIAAAAGHLGRLDDLQQTLRDCEDAILTAYGFAPLEAELRNEIHASTMRSGMAKLAAGNTPEPDLSAVLCAVQINNKATAAEQELASLLLRHGVRRLVAEGEVVWDESSTADYCVYVLTGEFHLLHDGRKIEVVVPGATLGFLFMLFPPASGGRRDTTLVGRMSQGSTLLVITREALRDLYESHPHLERLMLTAMLSRMAHEYNHWMRHHDHRMGPTS